MRRQFLTFLTLGLPFAFLSVTQARASAATGPDLGIALTHNSAFLRGQTNAVYFVRVTNNGDAPSSGPISVVESMPTGLTLTSLSGPGWTCLANSCSRSDVLAPGGMLPTITVVATVADDAPDSVINQVTVSGGGDGNAADNLAADQTAIASEGWLLGLPLNLTSKTVQRTPTSLSDVVAVAASPGMGGLALRKDGTVVQWTVDNTQVYPTPAGLTGVIAIAMNDRYFSAVKSDGHVVAWSTIYVEPSTAGISDVVSIAAGPTWALLLHADGSVSPLGSLFPAELAVPAGLANVVQLSVQNNSVAALTAQGTVAAWGNAAPPMPATTGRLTQVVALDSGALAGLRPDGTVVVWDTYGLGELLKVPADLNQVAALAGATYVMALREDGTVRAWGPTAARVPVFPSAAQTASTLASARAVVATQSFFYAILSARPVILTVKATASPVDLDTISGLPPYFTLDGVAFTNSYSTFAAPGGSHVLGTDPVVFTDGHRSRLEFKSWSDGGAPTHTITLGNTDATYTADFKPQHQLWTIAGLGGTIAPQTAYYDVGSVVQVAAAANSGYTFTGFSGDLTGTASPQSITLTGPKLVNATFSQGGAQPPTAELGSYSGSGSVALLAANFTRTPSSQQLVWVQILLAAALDGGGQPFCFIHYDVLGDRFWQYGDGGFFVGPVQPGTTSASLQNNLCAIDTSHSAAYTTGNLLSVYPRIVFKSGAQLNVYLRAWTQQGLDTGWLHRGTWTATPAAPVSMSVGMYPNNGDQNLFKLDYSDPTGFEGTGKGWSQFLIAAAPDGGGQPFCFLHYDRAGNGLWMYSGDVGFFLGPVAPGATSNALDSSACSVNPALSSVYLSPAGYQVYARFTLKPPMSGPKHLYLRTLDVLNRDTGWVDAGARIIP
ncbi:MAG: hypothetical protein J0H49_26615 [Acidobacteria bacterium]|nr:hypothetical protein [Acidobacteriota bacterium]